VQIMRVILQIRQHKANEVVLSECLIQVKAINAYESRIPKMTVFITFDVPIVFPVIDHTSSRDEAYMEVSRYPYIFI
jgi:hypothetical protein